MPEFPCEPRSCDHRNIEWYDETAGADEYVFEGKCMDCGADIYDGYTFEGRTVEFEGEQIHSEVSS